MSGDAEGARFFTNLHHQEDDGRKKGQEGYQRSRIETVIRLSIQGTKQVILRRHAVKDH